VCSSDLPKTPKPQMIAKMIAIVYKNIFSIKWERS